MQLENEWSLRMRRWSFRAWSSTCESLCCGVQVMKIGQVIRDEFDGKKDLSGIGGVETGQDAAEFLLLGANSVQVHPA